MKWRHYWKSETGSLNYSREYQVTTKEFETECLISHDVESNLDARAVVVAMTLPYTCTWYRVSWAYAMCPHWGGRRQRGPGKSVWCHMTGCQPGRGLRHSAGSTRPPPPPCTRTSTRGKPEASSPPPPPAETQRETRKIKGQMLLQVLFFCLYESTALATAVTAHMLICCQVSN